MKKKILMLIMLVIATISVQARDYTTTKVSELPQKAQTYLKTHFKAKVNHINIDKNILGNKDYEVILSNGSEIDFDNDGNMKEVDCGTAAVPSSVVPKVIQQYVRNNYKGRKITKIEVSKHKYEIELNNGLDLEFDRSGRFLRVDD